MYFLALLFSWGECPAKIATDSLCFAFLWPRIRFGHPDDLWAPRNRQRGFKA